MLRWVVGTILLGVNSFVISLFFTLFNRLMIYSVPCVLNLLFVVVITLFNCLSMVRAFAHGAMGRQIDPSWGGPICCIFITSFNRLMIYSVHCVLNSLFVFLLLYLIVYPW